ncbi:MAG TPA: L-2-hydroxyglutarate oxidase [Thermoanaerobaculaceae bacterium]|nr:L-2-hydroxyglutarate oxidase [Thermoanaerobaculaceae bacterium]
MAERAPYDVAVIGGGIVGVSTAMALAASGRARVVVVEKETRLAAHQTGNNSGVIHSGLYYKPGSLKARNCTAGREELYRFCAERGIPAQRCGKVVVATREAQLGALDELQRRGEANGLAGLRRLRAGEIAELEPHAAGIAGLYVPQTGIVDYTRVTEAYADEVRRSGGEILLGAAVRRVVADGMELVLVTARGELRCRHLVNCAGLQSDRVARMCGSEPDVRIVPFRGEYYELTAERAHLVRNLIYPVPNPDFPFLGVHFTRMIGGGVEAGPNAVLAFKREGYTRSSFSLRDSAGTLAFPGFWRMAGGYWRMGMGEMWRSWSKRAFVRALKELLPELEGSDVRRAGAGVRAQALARSGKLLDDFCIVEAPRQIHVLNAPSPAATASIAIGRTIAEMAASRFDLG